MLDLIPCGEVVIIELDQVKTKSSIIIPDEAHQGSVRLYQGTVLEVGERVRRVRPGDRVFFSKYGNSSVFRPSGVPRNQQKEFTQVFERDINSFIAEKPEDVAEIMSRDLIDVDAELIREAERLTPIPGISIDQLNSAIAVKRKRFETEQKEQKAKIEAALSRYKNYFQEQKAKSSSEEIVNV